MKSYGKQLIDKNDIDSVVSVLQSDFLTQGPQIGKFEQAIARETFSKYAVAASNATACLHIACLALDIGKKDIVWTSPISFVASANCAIYCGANVDFVDIDEETGLMSIKALSNKLAQAKLDNKLPSLVIPVHMCGQSCDMEAIFDLSLEYNFKIIEDASHAIGGIYKGSPIGSCNYSDISIFSFHPVKIITTGEGGVATTNNKTLEEKMRLLLSHGITRQSDLMEKNSHGPWYYEQQLLGYNYRLTDIQAALGLSQLEKLQHFVTKRNLLAKAYLSKLDSLDVKPLLVKDYGISSYHLFIILVNAEKRREIFETLHREGIGVNVHYIPIYLQPYYQKMGFSKGYCPNAEQYYSKALTLPLHPELEEDQITLIIDKLKQCI